MPSNKLDIRWSNNGNKVSIRWKSGGNKSETVRFNASAPPTSTLPALSLAFDGHGQNANPNKNGVYAVTNLNESGADSLANMTAGKFVIFPNLSGDIVSSQGIDLNIDDVYILGQTSPSGIQVRGTTATHTQPTFKFRGSNFIIEHMRFRAGETPGTNTNHSAFDVIENNATITVRDGVIKNVSMQFGDDNIASTWYNAKDISWLDCLFAAGTTLYQSNYSMLYGGGVEDQTMARCLMIAKDRNPNVQNAAGMNILNNVIYGDPFGPTFQHVSGKGYTHPDAFTANCEKNLIIRRNSGSTSDINFDLKNTSPVNAALTLQVYLDDNRRILRGADPATATAAVLSMYATGRDSGNPGNDPNVYVAGSRFATPSFTLLDPGTALFNSVTANAGASHNRDALDAACVADVTTGAIDMVQSTYAAYAAAGRGYPTMTGGSVEDIWDAGQTDYIKNTVKAEYSIAADTDTTQTFSNGGTSCDFLAILSAKGIL